MGLANVSLDDKYTVDSGSIYITGSQALVRLPLMQIARDKVAGHSTACFISGYRGSPLHNLDKELWRATKLLGPHPVHFQPAVNEDLAATAAWGTQQASLFQGARYDGVFSMWYGKGPGLDRSLDAMRHANLSGTSKLGGVLAIVGDDHAMMSSDVPATSEPTFIDLMMPTLYPGSVSELLELGLYGIALSRFCGAWVGFKAVSDCLDAVASVQVDPAFPNIILPADFVPPADGLHIREPDPWRDQEPRLRRHKMDAALAFARANQLNRVVIKAKIPRLGIIASGKATFDVIEALRDLGLDEAAAADCGISLLKISMPHPLDRDLLRSFGDGLEEVIVVEEKRRIIEEATKDALYGLSDARRPRVVGRFDADGSRLLSELGELDADDVTKVLGPRIAKFHQNPRLDERLAFLHARDRRNAAREALNIARTPYFCSGCPHNSSTRVPEGSLALGGVGCHFMATYMDRSNITHTHMGGEGANWIGIAPFVDESHIFQNLGDGTYFHSGLLAIRACVAANANITYKILYNDAVAMTGGQPVDGPLSPALVSKQVHAEGVGQIAVVTDYLETLEALTSFAPGTRFYTRDKLEEVQKQLRDEPGVSVLLYVQTCAAEKRRRRKRKELADPPQRIYINERVCEGCGDCGVQSNCLSVVPIDTEYGRKRRIDQSSCNKDYRCREGFCPSFVTLTGAQPKRSAEVREVPENLRLLPEPQRPDVAAGETYNLLVAGIGGTGVVTVGAMLTMAAHLEGLSCSSVDQFGMAQKGGAVTSHIRIANQASDIHSVRLGAGSADVLLGCDSLVSAGDLCLDALSAERSQVVLNDHQSITGAFTRDADLKFPTDSIERRIISTVGQENADILAATKLATGLMGDSIATNLFMLGVAYQKGLVPVAATSIERALELNGVAIDMNKQSFLWGRRACIDRNALLELVSRDEAGPLITPESDLDAFIQRRAQDLVAYQSERYAKHYRDLVETARQAEAGCSPGQQSLTQAVARYAFKLMAYKDEYEVARLYTDGAFKAALESQFDGDYSLQLHLAAPLLSTKDPHTGVPRKRRYGAWMLTAMGMLAKFKGIRGSLLDPFGYSEERRSERELVARYAAFIGELADRLNPSNYQTALELAKLPEQLRGFGHVKARHYAASFSNWEERLEAWRGQTQIEVKDRPAA